MLEKKSGKNTRNNLKIFRKNQKNKEKKNLEKCIKMKKTRKSIIKDKKIKQKNAT